MNPLPCYRCGALTWGTFGSLAYCAPCLRETRTGIRARLARKEPAYAPGILRCDRCNTIVEEGGPDDWFDLCRHGAHEDKTKNRTGWRCNGLMRRVTIADLEIIHRQIGGDAA